MIEVNHLVKKYGEYVAVNDISFKVNDGEVFAFLGPNGAGKTTTVKVLTTLLRPTSGSVRLDDIDPVVDPEGARRQFGIVFQDPSLDEDLTAWENMELHGVLYDMPNTERHSRAEELLKLVDLWDRKDEQVKAYSGGMKRRLEIARGLLHQPRILFLDEPTVGLDAQTRNLMWEKIEQLSKSKDMIVFLTTHYMEEAERIADRIAVMDHGKIIASGTAKELKEQTKTESLEDAFLALTGRGIREEEASAADRLRMQGRARGRR